MEGGVNYGAVKSQRYRYLGSTTAAQGVLEGVVDRAAPPHTGLGLLELGDVVHQRGHLAALFTVHVLENG